MTFPYSDRWLPRARVAFIGGDDGSGATAQAQADAAAREARIREGMSQIEDIFAPYNDTFYDQMRGAYVDYAMPQVNDQYVKGRNQLQYALARQGLGYSSVANDKTADLSSERALATNDVLQRGRDTANDARRDLERERQTITAQLQATADPEAAALAARAQASLASDAGRYESLGPLFQNATAGLVDMTRPSYGPYGEPQGSALSRLFTSSDRSKIVK